MRGQSMRDVLKYEHVEVSYHGRAVVRDVSVTLHAGEILGIVGQSGCGKSTLLQAAMGLLGQGGEVSRGEIWFEGQNLLGLSPRDMGKLRGAKLGMVVQNATGSFCPVRTVGSQMYESMKAHRKIPRAQAREKALALLEKLEFPDGPRIWNSYPFQLSGGMNQRVAIALAMLLEPLALLADEPTSALDVVAQKQVLGELLQLRELFGTAMVVVSHDMGVVSALADTVLVLHQGTPVEYGPAQQVLRHPQHPCTQQLLAAVPRLEGRK